MNRALLFALLIIGCLLDGACAPTARVTSGGPAIDTVRLATPGGPKARIAVASFEDKTGKGHEEIGDGMATMLTTALVNSGHFIVLERDLIDEVITEQDLASGERVRPGTGPATGEIEGAEIMVIGAVTEFEPQKFGLAGGFVGLGSLVTSLILHEQNSNVPVGAATFTESHIAIDVRLVDTATSRLLTSFSVEGVGQDWGGGIIAEIGGGKSRLPFGLGGFQKTAAGQAIRKAIDVAVTVITTQTPEHFFHHEDRSFTAGRIFGFAYLDMPGARGENFSDPQVRTAASAEEWEELASNLGLSGTDASPPVDFSTRQISAIAAGTQKEEGASIAVNKVVMLPEKVEITAVLLPPPDSRPQGGDKTSPSEKQSRNPVTLIHTPRTDLPVTVRWLSP